MTDFSHQQIAEKFAQAVKDGNIRFGRVASAGAMGQAIQVRQDSGQIVRAIAQNNCTPGEPCTLFFLGNEVRAYGSNDVGTIERSLRYRRHREHVASIEERILALLLYEKPAIAGLLVYEKPAIAGILAYLKKETLFAYLSILYETIQEERIACTCPTYNRLGNRCIPVCDGSGQYSTLAACLAAPEPPWPSPAGEDGGGGYVVMYAGHRVGSRGSTANWQYGGMVGGLYYQSSADQPCSEVGFDYVEHYAPGHYVRAKPQEFPGGRTTGDYWAYYYLPLVPSIDRTAYPSGAMLAYGKRQIATGGFRLVDENGWFLFVAEAVDVYIQGNPGYWYSPEDTAYAHYFIYKYVPASSFSGTSPPSPPASIGGMNVGGMTLFQNRAALICSPFNQRPDPTCQDPGPGGGTIACPYPEEKRSRRFWVGGSKQQPVLVHTLNFGEQNAAYLVKNDANKEIIKILAAKHSNAWNSEWCKLVDIEINGSAIAKQAHSNPAFPAAKPKEWKYPWFAYNYPSNNYQANTPAYAVNFIPDQAANILSFNNKNFLLKFDTTQGIQVATNEGEVPIWGRFNDLIKGSRNLKDGRVCLSLFNANNPLPGKGVAIATIYPIAQSANILAVSAYIKEDKLEESYNNSALGCTGTVFRRPYRERWYSGKQTSYRDLGLITYNDRHPPTYSSGGQNAGSTLSVKNCAGQVVQVLAPIYNGTIEPYGTEEVIGSCQ